MRVLCTLLILAASATSAFAVPITFIHTGTGSGSIGEVPFANAAFTITSIADTDSRESVDDVFSIQHSSSVIDIDGVGTFAVTSGTRTFVAQINALVGYSRPPIDGLDLYNGPNDAAFSSWDMLSSIGPIVSGAELLQWGVEEVATSGGILDFQNSSTQGSFQAIVVPEPASWALAAIGLAALCIGRLTGRRQ